MMKNLFQFILLVLTTGSSAFAFSTARWGNRLHLQKAAASTSSLHLSSDNTRDDRMKEILQQEAMNAENLKRSAREMQNMKPEDIDQMLADMDNMPPAQLAQLKALGMDPEMMKMTMKQMKANPAMFESVGKMMENMTPEELLEQSRIAQERMKQESTLFTPPAPTPAPPTPASSTVITAEKVEEDDDEDEDDEEIELDPKLLDTMYSVAEYMTDDKGGVTYPAFCSLPPMTVLAGSGEDDLSESELKECWLKGSLGATRVDRKGFERVWAEIQDQYYNPIIEEARERLAVKKKKKRGSTAAKPAVPATPVTPTSTNNPMVGANISPEVLQAQVKNMSDDDVSAMFEQMVNMTPDQEARMKAMGVDPGMMKQSAKMMKDNPLARKAATMMMKNASPEQLMKASQDAQDRLANMSEDEKKKFMGQ